jgi:hypothetical protein
MKNSNERTSGIALSISFIAYAVSLTQDAFCTQSSCVFGARVLITGWAGMFVGGVMLTWLANPLILIAWITVYKSPKISNACSIISSVLMLSFLYYKQIYNHQDEWTSDITKYGLGYYLWVVSGVTMVIGNACLQRPKQKLKNYKIL